MEVDKIMVRIGSNDIIVPKDQLHTVHMTDQSYIVGYEDEHGNKCDEEGNYLN